MYWTVFDDFPCTYPVHCLYFAYFWGCTESAKFCEKVENCLCRVCTQPVLLCTESVNGMYRVCFRTMYKQCLGRTESVHSLKNRVKNTVYTVFAVCRDSVFLILGKNTEPLYFCKKTVLYVQTMYISKTEFQLFGYRNRVTFEFICTHWENFIPTLRILQLDSLSRLAKDFVIAPIFFLVLTAAI